MKVTVFFLTKTLLSRELTTKKLIDQFAELSLLVQIVIVENALKNFQLEKLLLKNVMLLVWLMQSASRLAYGLMQVIVLVIAHCLTRNVLENVLNQLIPNLVTSIVLTTCDQNDTLMVLKVLMDHHSVLLIILQSKMKRYVRK